MKRNDKKQGFYLYFRQYEPVKDFTYEQKGKLFDRIFLYSMGQDELSDDASVEIAFKFIKTHLDMDGEKYQEFLKKQSENGKKGGRKRAEQLKSQKKPKNPTLENQPTKEVDEIPLRDEGEKKKKPLQAKRVGGSGKKSDGFGDPAINEIVFSIKEHHKTVDGTQNENRQFGKLLKEKLEKMEGFDGKYGEFIANLIKNATTYTIGKTTSPKKIYYNLAEILAAQNSKSKKVEKAKDFWDEFDEKLDSFNVPFEKKEYIKKVWKMRMDEGKSTTDEALQNVINITLK